jgi:hypothetical protein
MHSVIFLSILRAAVVLADGEAGSHGYGLPRIMGGGKFKAAFQNREAFGNAQPRDFKVGPVEERSPLIAGSPTIGPRQADPEWEVVLLDSAVPQVGEL